PPHIIPLSSANTNVLPATEKFGFSVVQVYRAIYFESDRPSLISINYSTQGDLSLFSLPCFNPRCKGSTKKVFRKPPNPFYLNAIKFNL
ncbi:MAG: hypothetical protein ACHQUC_09750, partial [Chlamydiales bacterium]